MNKNLRTSLILSLLVLGFVCLVGQPQKALAYSAFDADQSTCYSYKGLSSTASTVNVNLLPYTGIAETITIPNQNPPSILQGMSFAQGTNCGYNSNTSGTYSFWNGVQVAYTNPNFNLNLIINNGSALPFTGAPFKFVKDTTDPSAYWEETIRGWDYKGLSDMGYSSVTEDQAIDMIARTGTFKTQVSNLETGSYSQTATVSVPATNCVSLGGNGPIKVVFTRGRTWTQNSSASNFLHEVENVINNGYGKIDPFKKYFSQFSFYADLKKYADSSDINSALTMVDPITNQVFIKTNSNGAAGSVNSAVSSCASLGRADTYINFINHESQPLGAFAVIAEGIVGYDFAGPSDITLDTASQASGLNRNDTLAAVIIHEVGHAFAGLRDEYVKATQYVRGSSSNQDMVFADFNNPRILTTENCSSNPGADFRNPGDKRLYGAYLDKGCTYLLTNLQTGAKHPGAFYRPAVRSIMSSGDVFTGLDTIWLPKFNVISCGYIVAAINRQALSQANAGSHWAECATLDTAGKTEIPPVTAAPTVNSVTPVSGAINTFNVSGPTVPGYIRLNPAPGAFVPGSSNEANVYTGIQMWKDFFKKFIPVAHGQTVSGSYEIDTVTSVGPSMISFTVPSYIPDGTYTVSVSNPNSPWTDTPYTITVSGNGAGDPTTVIGTSGTTSGTGTTGGGVVSTDPTVPTYTCPTGYTLQSTNTCYKTSTAATLSYYCPSGGTYSYGLLNGVVGNYCNTGYNIYTATSYNTCPTGATLSGTQCNYSTINATAKCTTGYVLSGSSCILPSAVVYKCPTGYTLDSSKICYKAPVLQYDSTGTHVTGYSCPIGTSLTGDNTKCIYNAGPTISCTTGYTLQTNNTCTITASVQTSIQAPLLSVSTPVKGAVSLSWTKVDDGSGSYVVKRLTGTVTTYTANAYFPDIAEVLPGTTSYIDKTVAPATSYIYKVAYKTTGGITGTSKFVSIKTLAKPATPVIKISSTLSDAIVVTLSDTDAASITGYGLSQSIPVVKSIFDNRFVTTYTVGGLSPLTKYCFNAVAYANSSRSATSSAVCTTTLKAATVSTQAPITTTLDPVSTTEPTIGTPPSAPTQPTPVPTVNSVPATITYSCGNGATPVNNQCTSTVLSTTGGVNANKTTECEAGYTKINSTLCKNKTTLATTTTTVVYTCGSARTLNLFDNKCYTTTQVTSPAIQSYSCPSGYTLNSIDNTCKQIVSSDFPASTTTATAFDAFMNFFRNLFR
ncbi:MAG: hypothetical protein PHG25_01170 [Candidatus Pacebacteria bacterium]|nr:hypothetical protein [Candidatus Paceibacterota bacterium]